MEPEMIVNITTHLVYQLIFGFIDEYDVKLAQSLEHLDVDWIKIIAGANVENLAAAVRLAAEELLKSIKGVTK